MDIVWGLVGMYCIVRAGVLLYHFAAGVAEGFSEGLQNRQK